METAAEFRQSFPYTWSARSSASSNQSLRIPYWCLWIDSNGVSHQKLWALSHAAFRNGAHFNGIQSTDCD